MRDPRSAEISTWPPLSGPFGPVPMAEIARTPGMVEMRRSLARTVSVLDMLSVRTVKASLFARTPWLTMTTATVPVAVRPDASLMV